MQPFLAEFALNTEWFKYTLLVASSPFWWPFVRELYKEFNDILAEEGGLLGRKPTDKELGEIRRRKAAQEAALVRELREEGPSGRGGRRRSAPRDSFGNSQLKRRGAAPGTARRGGFGPPR